MNFSQKALLEAVAQGFGVIGGTVHKPGGEVQKTYMNGGYPAFHLTVDPAVYGRRSILVYVHRLVALIKYGDKVFDSSLEVRHGNSNKSDFSFDNILLGTKKQNANDADPVTGLNPARNRRFMKGLKFLSVEEVAEARRCCAMLSGRRLTSTYNDLAESFGVTPQAIKKAVYGKSYAWVTDPAPLTKSRCA